LCHNCATSSSCEGRCNIQGTLTCLDPCECTRSLTIRQFLFIFMLGTVPVGVGPIEWNYQCAGTRDPLNNLQRVTACFRHFDLQFTE
jgi:hypothetical protein